MRKTMCAFTFLFVLFLTFACGPVALSEVVRDVIEPCEVPQAFTTAGYHTPHAPIVIFGDADFLKQEWPGNGSQSSPYVIQGLSIADPQPCIMISYTTDYFEIRDCIISSSMYPEYCSVGIVLTNVSHGTIRDCTVHSEAYGIELYGSTSCTLMNNIASSNSYFGFLLSYSDTCTLTNNTATNNSYHGFQVVHSSGCILTNNTGSNNLCSGFSLDGDSYACTLVNNTATSNSLHGFRLYCAYSCTLKNNTLADNGMYIYGWESYHWIHEVSGNMVNGKPLGYFADLTSTAIDGSRYGQIILANCSDVTIRNGAFANASIGVELGFCYRCTLINNTASGNSYSGFHLDSTEWCTLMNNTATNNSIHGFDLDGWGGNVLANNIATDNLLYGFAVYHLGKCTLMNNTATSNLFHGFYVHSSAECTLIGNRATDNLGNGIYMDNGSSWNKAYLNRLAFNHESNARDDGNANRWDDAVSLGNCWIDYNGSGTYSIPGSAGSVDHYPFGWNMTDVAPPTMDSPADISYEEDSTGHAIVWTPSDLHPDRYVLSIDRWHVRWLLRLGPWNGSSITVNVDGLYPGTYSCTLVVFDASGHCNRDTVLVTVISSTISSTTARTTTTTTRIRTDFPLSVLTIIEVAALGAGISLVAMALRFRKKS